MTLGGITATFEQFDQGITANGKRYLWIGNRRIGYLDVESYQWTADTTFTTTNYAQVLASGNLTLKLKDGTTYTQEGVGMGRPF